MKLISIGHQSWSLVAGSTHVLIDPILGSHFGSDVRRLFQIIPPRSVMIDRMPTVDAIIFTSEHLQHFSPATLAELRNLYPGKISATRVYIPELFPVVAQDLIEAWGYKVIRIDMERDFWIGELHCRFYRPANDILYWDNRVASIYVRDAAQQTLFIQSDTRISENFYRDVKAQVIPVPDVMVVTNNYQSSADGCSVGLDNLLPLPDPKYTRLAGLRLLEEIISHPIKKLPTVPTMIISGNGYSDAGHKIYIPWSNEKLASIASRLSLRREVYAMCPGQCFEVGTGQLNEGVDWIVCGEKNRENVIPAIKMKAPEIDIDELKKHLDTMARTWLVTRYGQALMAHTEYLGQPLGTKRLVLRFTGHSSGPLEFVLDISRVEFIRVRSRGSIAIKQYPFGICVDYKDYSQLLSGVLQVWELINLSASQWFLCDRFDSPLAFWLEYYNEQVDYERASCSYQAALLSSL